MTPSFFTSSFYLSHCRFFLSSNFKNSKRCLPQLECAKVVEATNATWRPKVTEVNNNIWHSKVAKSNNVTVNVFYTFLFSSISFSSILQNTMINKFFIGFHLYIENRKIIASHPSCETWSCTNFQPFSASLPFLSFFLHLFWCMPTL